MISDRMWERAAFLTRHDTTPQADFTAALAAAHCGKETVMVHIGSNVPDSTPHVLTLHHLDTGLGAILRAEA